MYRVFVTSRAGARLGELPADGLSFEHRIGGAGSAQLKVRLEHPNAQVLDPWATELLVHRDGQTVFDGPVVDVDANAVGGELSVSAAAASHWLSRRYVTSDLDFAQYDPADLLTVLVGYAQDTTEKGPAAECRLLTSTEPTGLALDRTYLAAERAQISGLVQQLADAHLDLRMTYSSGLRVLQAAARLGRDVDTPLRLGSGGLTGLTVKRTGDKTTTRVLGVGNGEGSDQITATAPAVVDDTHTALEARYGVHEQPLSAGDVKDQPTLQALVDGQLALHRPPVQVVAASYRVTDTTRWDLCTVGDRVRVIARRGWVQVDTRLRVVAHQTQVSPSGTETVALTFNDPTET